MLHWKLFILTGLIVTMSPGPAMLYCIATSMKHGRLHGIVAGIGVEIGASIYLLATVLGLTAIILSLPTLFRLIQLVGALYLLYLGVMALKHWKSGLASISEKQLSHSYKKGLAKGIAINLFNPKVALSFIALLPQFVNQHSAHVSWEFFLLGGIFILMGLIMNISAALIFSSGAIGRLKQNPDSRWIRLKNILPGLIFLGLGLTMLIQTAISYFQV